MGTIDRGLGANTFKDDKLEVGTKFILPKKQTIPDSEGPGSLGLGPNRLLIYEDQDGVTREIPIDRGTKINDDGVSTLETWSSQEISDRIAALSQALITHPVYQAPTAALTANLSTSGLEVGQTINLVLTASFTQRNAGTQTGVAIKRDGTTIGSVSPYTDQGVVMGVVPKVYSATISYGQGAVLNNALGVPDPIGRIAAGSVNTGSLSFRGYYRMFFGSDSAAPADSAEARAMNQNQLLSAAMSVVLNTGTVNIKQYAVVPPGFSLSSAVDLDASGAVVNYALINSNFTVNDLKGVAVPGHKLYERTQGVPYSTSHRHQLNLTVG